jgi:hypothetical protein
MDKLFDDRHEGLRDAIEYAIRSAIEKVDKDEVTHGGERYTYAEVNWVLAHVTHDLIRFGPIKEEPTDWSDVEEFISKLRLTNLDTRYTRDNREPWLPRGYDQRLDNHCIPWFYEDK